MVPGAGVITKDYLLTCLAPVLRRLGGRASGAVGDLQTYLCISVWFLHIAFLAWWLHNKWTSYMAAQGSERV